MVKFVPSHFIFLEEIMSGAVFLVSLYDSSLLVYKNATDFWMFFKDFIYLLLERGEG